MSRLNGFVKCVLAFVALVALISAVPLYHAWGSASEVIVTVERVAKKVHSADVTKEDYYIVKTREGQEFANTESFWRGKSRKDAEKLQKYLRECRGRKVRVRYYGWKSHLFGNPNIVGAEAVD